MEHNYRLFGGCLQHNWMTGFFFFFEEEYICQTIHEHVFDQLFQINVFDVSCSKY